jgi:ribosomal protein L12E/L44/L45/RPP1/RPP2
LKKLKIFLSALFILFLASKANGQTFTQTFIDKCSGEVKVATTTYVNGNAVVSFYNQVKVFTPTEVQSGALKMWLQATYVAYSTTGCPTNIVVQQTVQQTVNQAVQQAASAAATQAAAAAASKAAEAAAEKRQFDRENMLIEAADQEKKILREETEKVKILAMQCYKLHYCTR